MEELISVVIPVYNVQAYISECMDSILSQTHQNLQILAVNDGSPDDSVRILEEYAAKDSRVRVLNKPNGGLSDARNFGLKYAEGEYVCFIDGDDTISQYFAEHLYRKMKQENADIAVSDMEYVFPDGRREYSEGGKFESGCVKDNPELILINNSACNKLYRTSLFDGIDFPVGKLYEDLATVPVLVERAGKIVKVNEPLYYYRQAREGSIRHSVTERIFEIYDAVARVKQYAVKDQADERVLAAVDSLYCIHCLDSITLKIKSFDDRDAREAYLKKNMTLLKQAYPAYMKDSFVKNASFKKKLIYRLLDWGKYATVLKIYDR